MSNEITPSSALPGQRSVGSLPSLPGIPAWASSDQTAAPIPAQSGRLTERLLAARVTED